MSPSLSVVADNDLKTITAPKNESVSERVRRLQAEAKQLAKDHIKAMVRQIADLEGRAAVSFWGDAQADPPKSMLRTASTRACSPSGSLAGGFSRSSRARSTSPRPCSKTASSSRCETRLQRSRPYQAEIFSM